MVYSSIFRYQTSAKDNLNIGQSEKSNEVPVLVPFMERYSSCQENKQLFL